jgi:hypothetical protein
VFRAGPNLLRKFWISRNSRRRPHFVRAPVCHRLTSRRSLRVGAAVHALVRRTMRSPFAVGASGTPARAAVPAGRRGRLRSRASNDALALSPPAPPG